MACPQLNSCRPGEELEADRRGAHPASERETEQGKTVGEQEREGPVDLFLSHTEESL